MGLAKDSSQRPNIVYILADDLGYADVGCYGQEKIATPRLDRMAREGMRFTDHYAGAPLCAPARSAFATGQHTGHTRIRHNRPKVPLQPEDSLKEYRGRWEETPYPGAHYAGQPEPRAARAGMITRMDRDVGRIFDLIEELGLAENTLVIFTSDNGPAPAGKCPCHSGGVAPKRTAKGTLICADLR